MSGGPPGAIVVVQRPGRRSVYRAGVRDTRSGRPVRASDHMRIASTAKAFSAAVALALVDRGKLSLDETIAARLPWLPAAWGRVTLRDALRHTSGLPDFSASPAFRDYVPQHLDARPSPRFLLGFVADEPLEFRPGSRYRYSNTDNFVVALMAEAATGRPYEQLLARTGLPAARAAGHQPAARPAMPAPVPPRLPTRSARAATRTSRR